MINFLIAPDFPPEHFAGWHILNTILQKQSNVHIHLLTPSSAEEQSALIAKDNVDLIYANPFDAAELVRDKGYLPLARPINKPDEMVIATSAASPLKTLADIKPGMKVALTNNRDMKLIGLRLLESVDITEADLEWVEVESFQASARLALQEHVDFSFFVASSYHSLSKLTKERMHPLIESHLHDIYHMFLLHPRLADKLTIIQNIFVGFKNHESGQRMLNDLAMPEGLAELHVEETEFMIDLMDTLLD